MSPYINMSDLELARYIVKRMTLNSNYTEAARAVAELDRRLNRS
jgi:CII-binding regulator of phage lambda lysogenization HflD